MTLNKSLYAEIKTSFTDYGFKLRANSIDDDGNGYSLTFERGGLFIEVYLWERDFSKATISVYDKGLPNWTEKESLTHWIIEDVNNIEETVLKPLFGMIQSKKKGLKTYKNKNGVNNMRLTFLSKIFAANGFSQMYSEYDLHGNEDNIHFSKEGIYVAISDISTNEEDTLVLIKADYRENLDAPSKTLKQWKITDADELEQNVMFHILGMLYAKKNGLRVYINTIYK